jgi:hypothetical protein
MPIQTIEDFKQGAVTTDGNDGIKVSEVRRRYLLDGISWSVGFEHFHPGKTSERFEQAGQKLCGASGCGFWIEHQ